MSQNTELTTLAGGCFWCTEAIFKRLKGVKSVISGYSGGMTENPTYEQICNGNTGHAESIQIEFNPSIIPFKTLLEVFFDLHNPTTLNQQGADIGTQYRSAIFYHNLFQKDIAEKLIKDLNNSGKYTQPIVTEVSPFKNFYPAEEYHQNYYESQKNSFYCQIVIDPKLQKLYKNYPAQTKKEE